MGTHPIFESDFDCLTDRFGFLNNEASAPFARSYCGRWRLRRCQGACRHREGTTRRTRQELQALEGRNEIYWSPFHSCGKVDGFLQGQGRRPHRLLAHFQHVKGCYARIPLQAPCCLRAFPHQLHRGAGWRSARSAQLFGEKFLRKVPMAPGVTVEISKAQKDELYVNGNDIELVSKSAARIQQSTTVKNKDIRKFLDGLYVSEKTTIVIPEAD